MIFLFLGILAFHVILVVPGTSKTSIFLQEYQRFQHGAARSPPNRSKTDFQWNSAKNTAIQHNSIKMVKFHKIQWNSGNFQVLVVPWLWRINLAQEKRTFREGSRIWPNADFPNFSVISWNLVISHKFTEIPEFTRIS